MAMPNLKKKQSQNNLLQRGSMPLFIGLGGVALCATAVVYVWLPSLLSSSYERAGVAAVVNEVLIDKEATSTPETITQANPYAPLYIPTPEPMKAIYMSQCVVGTPSFRNDLVTLIDETELNAVIIDIKDYTGKISFPTANPLLADSVSDACGANDMASFVRSLKEKGIYVIGRITVFQDPYFTAKHPELAVKKASNKEANWKDNKGLSFIDVSARPYWEYVVALSKEARALGFDELNYDYVRFPSDGPMQDIYFPHSGTTPKPEALEKFFAYLNAEVKPTGATMSADLFGMTMTNTDDLNIGQVLERALPYFDYIMPMVYPSHYPKSFLGLGNPNTNPYLVVHHSMKEGVRRTVSETSTVKTLTSEPMYKMVTATSSDGTVSTTQVFSAYKKPVYSQLKLRPWLQDFDYGGTYDVKEVRAQIQATYDAGLTSWLLWAPSNRYTKGALEPFYKAPDTKGNAETQ